MKKLLLVAMVVAFGFAANAQEGKFKAGINFGLPTGEMSNVSSFSLGIDLNYLWEVGDKFELGVAASYLNYFGKTVTINFGGTSISGQASDLSFLPLAGAARYNASEEFVLGADLGYAIGLSPDGNKGGMYYRPMIGYNVSEKTQINVSYSGITRDGSTASNIALGVAFSF